MAGNPTWRFEPLIPLPRDTNTNAKDEPSKDKKDPFQALGLFDTTRDEDSVFAPQKARQQERERVDRKDSSSSTASSGSDFGAFVSVQPEDDPLGGLLVDFSQSPPPLSPTPAAAATTFSSLQFVKDAKARSEAGEKKILEEYKDGDPILWFGLGSTSTADDVDVDPDVDGGQQPDASPPDEGTQSPPNSLIDLDSDTFFQDLTPRPTPAPPPPIPTPTPSSSSSSSQPPSSSHSTRPRSKSASKSPSTSPHATLSRSWMSTLLSTSRPSIPRTTTSSPSTEPHVQFARSTSPVKPLLQKRQSQGFGLSPSISTNVSASASAATSPIQSTSSTLHPHSHSHHHHAHEHDAKDPSRSPSRSPSSSSSFLRTLKTKSFLPSPSTRASAIVSSGTPFASHPFTGASGAPGFAGEDRRWNKGFDEGLSRDELLDGFGYTDDGGGGGGSREMDGFEVVNGNVNTSTSRSGSGGLNGSGAGGGGGGANASGTAGGGGGGGGFKKKGKGIKLLGRTSGGDDDDENDVITSLLATQIHANLPPLPRLSTSWTLLYSLDQHGISLNTLYSNTSSYTGGMVLGVMDVMGNVFGVWVGEGVRLRGGGGGAGDGALGLSLSGFSSFSSSSFGGGGGSGGGMGGYYGSGDAFLFTTLPSPTSPPPSTHTPLPKEPVLTVYNWTGKNDYVALCEMEGLSFGGGDGHPALFISPSLLEGTSHPCPTFGNEVLACGERLGRMVRFEVVGLEVWGVGE